MGFSKQEYWSGFPFPSPDDHPDPGIEPRSLALQVDSLPSAYAICQPGGPITIKSQLSYLSPLKQNTGISSGALWAWGLRTIDLRLLLPLPSRFSLIGLWATPQMAAHQAPQSLGFSRQEHWTGLPFPSPMHESEKSKWSRLVVSDS